MVDSSKSSEIQVKLPSRPQFGQQLQKIKEVQLFSNCYVLNIDNFQGSRYQMAIQILDENKNDVPTDNRYIFRQSIKNLKEQLQNQLGFHVQRGAILFSVGQLKDALTYTTKIDNKEYTIIIKQTQKISLEDYEVQHFEGRGNIITQFMNIIIKQLLQELKFIEMGKLSKFYNPAERLNNKVKDAQVDYQMTVWRGIFTSSQIWNKIPYLLLNPCSKVCRNESALEFIKSFQSKEEAKQNLIDKSVIANYGNARNYVVFDLDFNSNPLTTFDKNGEKITIKDYMKKTYNKNINDNSQPLIVTYRKQKGQQPLKLLLVPELVNMTGLEDEMRRDFKLMKALANFTKMSPNERITYNNQKVEQLNSFGKKIGVSIENKTPQLKGYVLPKPDLDLGNNQKIIDPKDNFQINKSIVNPAVFENWVLMHTERDRESSDILYDNLCKTSKSFGIHVKEPEFIEMKSQKPEDWTRQLDNYLNKAKVQPQIVVTLTPTKTTKIYNAIKQVLIVHEGIAHQNVAAKSLQKNTASICSNIILQMNAKMGNMIWSVPRTENVEKKKTMMIGIDVYHHNKNQSWVGFVSSLDPRFTKYNSQVFSQGGKGKEFLTNLTELMNKALNEFFLFTKKKFLPEQIIIYRDGVGDSQLEVVLTSELQQVQKSFEKFENYKPNLAFICVNKKIQNFFAKKDGNQMVNPDQGTIVADKCTSQFFDFYLMAQNVREGTCTPTHYTVIHNSTQLSQEEFWQLTYNQCFNYYNWRGAVRVPAPCQYAHKLAYITGQIIQDKAHENLNKTHYYL